MMGTVTLVLPAVPVESAAVPAAVVPEAVPAEQVEPDYTEAAVPAGTEAVAAEPDTAAVPVPAGTAAVAEVEPGCTDTVAAAVELRPRPAEYQPLALSQQSLPH